MNSNIDIISKLLVTARALEKAGDEILSRFGITMGMYEILTLIANQVDTTTKMANLSQITLSSITHKTKFLEDKGYIQRVVNNEDKRVWHFSITKKGQRLLDTVHAVYEEITANLFTQFSEAEKQQTLTVLTATEQHLGYALQNRRMMAEHIDSLLKQKGIRICK